MAAVYQSAAHAAFNYPDDDPQEIFRSVIAKAAPSLKIEETVLFDKTRAFLRRFPLMAQQMEESNRRIEILADTSNDMNEEKLRKELQSSAKPNSRALFVLGKNHLPLIASVYAKKVPDKAAKDAEKNK